MMSNERAREVLLEQITRYGQEYDTEGIEALAKALSALERMGHYEDDMKAEAYKKAVKRYGTIETLKIVKYWDDREPEEFVKSEISLELARCLLSEGYIDFKVDDNYNEYNMMRRVIGTIKVTKEKIYDDEM